MSTNLINFDPHRHSSGRQYGSLASRPDLCAWSWSRQNITEGLWINPCCPQVILSSAFSLCCSVSLPSWLLSLPCVWSVRAMHHARCCHVALTVVLLKSYESQKIGSSQRFIYHGSGAQLICAGVNAVGTARWSKRCWDGAVVERSWTAHWCGA